MILVWRHIPSLPANIMSDVPAEHMDELMAFNNADTYSAAFETMDDVIKGVPYDILNSLVTTGRF